MGKWRIQLLREYGFELVFRKDTPASEMAKVLDAHFKEHEEMVRAYIREHGEYPRSYPMYFRGMSTHTCVGDHDLSLRGPSPICDLTGLDHKTEECDGAVIIIVVWAYDTVEKMSMKPLVEGVRLSPYFVTRDWGKS